MAGVNGCFVIGIEARSNKGQSHGGISIGVRICITRTGNLQATSNQASVETTTDQSGTNS